MELKECLKRLDDGQAIRFHAVCVGFQSRGGKWPERLKASEADLLGRMGNNDRMSRIIIGEWLDLKKAAENEESLSRRIWNAILGLERRGAVADIGSLVGRIGRVSASAFDSPYGGTGKISVIMEIGDPRP